MDFFDPTCLRHELGQNSSFVWIFLLLVCYALLVSGMIRWPLAAAPFSNNSFCQR